MRYITLLFIIIISLFTINLAQDTDHSNHTSEHSTEHSTEEEHSQEHSTEDEKHSHSTEHSTEHSIEHSEADTSEHAHTTETTESHKIEHSSSETNPHTEHSTKTESANMHHEHASEDMSSEDHSDHSSSHELNDMSLEHSQHEHATTSGMASETMSDKANTVMLGEKTLSLFPLLSQEGDFQLIVSSDKAGYTTSVSFEDTSLKTTYDESGITSLDLGKIKQGNYYLTFRDISNEITAPVSVYKSLTPSGKSFTTIFAPNPSLSSQGKSEIFVYNIADGENQHELISVNYSMVGMQHVLDDTVTPLTHEHFDSLKSSIADEALDKAILNTVMSNRSTLSFAMAGPWEFNVIVADETLTFDIAVLDN